MKTQTKSLDNLEELLQQETTKQYGIVPKRTGNFGVIYTRVSSQEQATSNGSLEVQKKFCDEFTIRSQIPVRAYFGGTYESAKDDGRKEFKRMLAFVRKHKEVKYIIVFNYDTIYMQSAQTCNEQVVIPFGYTVTFVKTDTAG